MEEHSIDKELNIHITYIRKDIEEMKGTLKDIKANSPTRVEFDELKINVKSNTDKINSLLGDRRWLIGVASTLLFLQALLLYVAKVYTESTVKDVLATYDIEIK